MDISPVCKMNGTRRFGYASTGALAKKLPELFEDFLTQGVQRNSTLFFIKVWSVGHEFSI